MGRLRRATGTPFPAILLLPLALTLAGCERLPSAPEGCGIAGIDVSHHQGAIDWPRVARAGVGFAWIKATEGGDWRDPAFQRNWHAARAAGIRTGAYHYMSWCRPPEEQVAWFLANVPLDPDALPPVLDVEWSPGSKSCPATVARDVAIAKIMIVLAAMERVSGRLPIIYAPSDIFRDVLDGSLGDAVAADDPLGRYPLWVRGLGGQPAAAYGTRSWTIWQHAETGHVPGIGPDVDLDCLSPKAAFARP